MGKCEARKQGLNSGRVLASFFEQMVLIRYAEVKILEAFSKGLLSGTTHTCIGQETCCVGVVNALNLSKDIILSNHRNHGHFLAYCRDLEGLFGELMGKALGVCKGVGGSQHLHKENFYTNGIQGGMIPCATGMALAEKIKGTGAVVCVFLGDGTLGQGVVYESLNIASLWTLPILFVVEANEYAQSTPTHMQHAGDIAKRAAPFGISSRALSANNVLEVYNAALEAVEAIRDTGRPFYLVLYTYRLAPHSKGDDFRPQEEIEQHKASDPLKKARAALEERLARAVEDKAKARVEKAFAKAWDAAVFEWSDLMESRG